MCNSPTHKLLLTQTANVNSFINKMNLVVIEDSLHLQNGGVNSSSVIKL